MLKTNVLNSLRTVKERKSGNKVIVTLTIVLTCTMEMSVDGFIAFTI